MEAARSYVINHTARRGHTTRVEEFVRPAITSERILPRRHEIVTEAIDREVHQHHYHTTVQPLFTTVTLPTKHVHNLLPARRVTHQLDDLEATQRRVAADAAQFRNVSITLPTTHSQRHMPMVIGTHYHHHVHETVQPIIYKETIVPEVVHTTIPIHEHHIMEAKHHNLSALPVKSMSEFEALKASSRGRQDYDGPPRPYESSLHTTFEKLALGLKPAAQAPTGRDSSLNSEPAVQAPTGRDRNLNIEPAPYQRESTRRRSSSSSASSLSSIEQPKTPHSPRSPRASNMYAKPMANIDAMPTKPVNSDRPVQIVDSTSPRMSNESTGLGQGRNSGSRRRRFW